MENERKKELLEKGTYKRYTSKRRQAFMLKADELLREEPLRLDDRTGEVMETKQEHFFQMDGKDIADCERIRKAMKNQRERVEEHLSYLFQRKDLECFFLTFTFNDDAMKMKPDTRKQAIRRILSGSAADYILNIDFGKENEREHYHAIAAFPKEEKQSFKKMCEDGKERLTLRCLESYRFGFSYTEKVKTETKDGKRLAHYMKKLTLHSVKVKQQYLCDKKGSDFQLFKKAKKRVTSQSMVNPKAYEGIEKALHPSVGRFIAKGREKTEDIQLIIDPYAWKTERMPTGI